MRKPLAFVLAGLAYLATASNGGALTATPTPTPTRTPFPTPVPGELILNEGTLYTVPGNVQFLTTADFNLDGVTDVALSSSTSKTVTLLQSDGFGEFSQIISSDPFGVQPEGIAAGDLNGDGAPDVAVSDFRGNTMVVLLGQGNGFVGQPSSFRALKGPFGITMGDFNGDEVNDVAVADSQGGNVSVFFNLNPPTHLAAFSSPTNLPSTDPIVVENADVDGDGNLDLLALNTSVVTQGASNVKLFSGDGAGGFSVRGNFAVGNAAQRMAVADFDDDGFPDFAVTNSKFTSTVVITSAVTVLVADGSGSFLRAQEIDVSCAEIGADICAPVAIAAGDFDLDGVVDLAVVVNQPAVGTGLLVVYPGNGDGTFGDPGEPVALSFNASSMVAVDLDQDGKLDLVIGGATHVQAFHNLTVPPPTPTPTPIGNITPTVTGSITPPTKTPGMKPNGAQCSSGAECASGICTNNICTAPSTGDSIGRSGGCSTTGSDSAPWALLWLAMLPLSWWLQRRWTSPSAVRAKAQQSPKHLI